MRLKTLWFKSECKGAKTQKNSIQYSLLRLYVQSYAKELCYSPVGHKF